MGLRAGAGGRQRDDAGWLALVGREDVTGGSANAPILGTSWRASRMFPYAPEGRVLLTAFPRGCSGAAVGGGAQRGQGAGEGATLPQTLPVRLSLKTHNWPGSLKKGTISKK